MVFDLEKIIIAQNPEPNTLHISDKLSVFNEEGDVVGVVTLTHNICLSMGDIRIELTLYGKDYEKLEG